MPLTFKKIASGANRVFKKIDSGANTFFKKTVPDIANKAGNIGNQIAGGAKQVGNFLEKNSGILSTVAAGAAMALGQPELAAPILAAGATGQAVGSRIKQGGQQAQRGINALTSATQNASQNALQLQGQVRNAVANMPPMPPVV